jgi:hypothetical protein
VPISAAVPALFGQRAPKGHSAVGTRSRLLSFRLGPARVLNPQLGPVEGASGRCPQFGDSHEPAELADQCTYAPLVRFRQLRELGYTQIAVRTEGAASRPASTDCLELCPCVRFAFHLIDYSGSAVAGGPRVPLPPMHLGVAEQHLEVVHLAVVIGQVPVSGGLPARGRSDCRRGPGPSPPTGFPRDKAPSRPHRRAP